jgi:hypothetical protein
MRAKRPPRVRAQPSRTIITPAVVAALTALALASPTAAPAASTSAVRLSKRDAHRVAVRATAATCRAVAWCRGYDVVPAARCRRDGRETVYCTIAFITTQGQRCGGMVGVRRTRRGRLDRVMAVPSDCSTGDPSLITSD